MKAKKIVLSELCIVLLFVALFVLSCLSGQANAMQDASEWQIETSTFSLFVDFEISPSVGYAPLNNVDLTVIVSGSATGPIKYSLDCTNDGVWERIVTTDSTSYTAVDLCDYPDPGDYKVRVRVERQGLVVEGTSTIVVVPADNSTATPEITVTSVPTPTPIPTPSSTPVSTNTPISSSTPTKTPTPTPTPTGIPTPTCTPTPTPTSTPTKTPTPTLTLTNTPTRTSTPTHTPIRTPTPTPTSVADTTNPTLNAFDTQPRITNGPITISWTASDYGGSHLAYAKILRAADNGDRPGTWYYIKTVYVSSGTDGPWSYSVTDEPAEGVWWYGIHIYDGAGNYVTESGDSGQSVAMATFGIAVLGATTQDYRDGPTKEIMDKTPPDVLSFSVEPYRYEYASPAYLIFNWFAIDTVHAGLEQAEIWRTSDPSYKELRIWEQVAVKQAPLFTFWWNDSIWVEVPPGGLWWYGIHITDRAGNWNVEPDPPGPLPIAIGFLEPPVRGSTPAMALIGHTGKNCGDVGRVNAWFDHRYPNQTYDDYIYLWTGEDPIYAPNSKTGRIGVDWYDGHEGIDFCRRYSGEKAYASASGTVIKTGWTSEGGNYVLVVHPNHFATYYGHLATIDVFEGKQVSSFTAVGTMGGHLHFGLFYDRDTDGNFFLQEEYDGDSLLYLAEGVDPFGWKPTETGIPDPEPDPWDIANGINGSRSYYMWKEISPIYTLSVREGEYKVYLPLVTRR